MKTVTQNYKSGELKLEETPPPQLQDGCVLVQTSYSLISAGTEKMKVDTGRKNLLGKARARPDLVKQVLEKAKKEGLLSTWKTVSERLNTTSAMGYSSAGIVIDTKGDVGGLQCGDRVACGGSQANHAEIVSVPKNLAVPVPEAVTMDYASFTTVGAIAMQGVRQADTRIGEKVAVIGLGLIGLITIQILKAGGCRVFGIDIDPSKIELAKKLGCHDAVLSSAEDLEDRLLLFTDGYGADATLVTAATSSNQPIEQAAAITRQKGRVVVVGAAKMDLPREPFYLKELELRLSCSYGPGRYDKAYEDEGRDYPFGYVRFTEKRNMQSFLELLEQGDVQLEPIITHRYSIDDATKAYDLIEGAASEPYLGILLEYQRSLDDIIDRVELKPKAVEKDSIGLGVIGAGRYATSYLLPPLAKNDKISFQSICTASGMTAVTVAKKFGFASAESDIEAVVNTSDALLVATRHNDHASYVARAIRAGKPVFVEKPLAITQAQLDEVIEAASDNPEASVMVGFNRRFSPAFQRVTDHVSGEATPRQVLIRVNAGKIPQDHWIQDPRVGGGRLLGEGCHFVDLAVALTGSCIETVSATAVPEPGRDTSLWDNFSISMGMANGSVASIVYTSGGDRGVSKEYVEVHGGGRTAVIHDFKGVDLWANGKKEQDGSSQQDKGQGQQMKAWVDGLKSGSSPIPFQEIINVHRACLSAIRSMEERKTIHL